MLFSSTIFLFAFLPIVLTLYVVSPVRTRNLLLLGASLLFYAWGEARYTLLLLVSIALNYGFGLWIERRRGSSSQRLVLGFAVTGNLLLLGFFKYANFVVDDVLAPLGLRVVALDPVHLPIGISFFTFQAITYVVDVYRRDAEVQRSPIRVALYISLFPQLIAGPIVRYRSIAQQLVERHASSHDVASGIRRFVIGLGKKVLVANHLAIPADAIFAIPSAELQPSVAWLGAVCFALQIYFDFAGYSDMAIGLGRILGFGFPENFDAPYTSRSIREFWRRWHMSLSTWFRDYLYIPLGGNRGSTLGTSVNLFAVFLLCGLWHGASWNFVVWGLLHGSFLAAERGPFGRWLTAAPAAVARLYTLLVVLVAWVFFRAETLPEALAFLGAMMGIGTGASAAYPLALYLDPRVALVVAIAVLGSTARPRAWVEQLREASGASAFAGARLAFLGSVLVGSAMALAAGTHNPFIYFRF